MAGNLFWGVDSFNVVNKPMVGTGSKTLFDFVVDNLGRPPEFWGRYVLRAGSTSQPPLTSSELDFIAAQNKTRGTVCKVLPVYLVNKDTAKAGNEKLGDAEAASAIDAAKNAGLPTGRNIVIYADLEYVQPSLEWLKGWVGKMNGPHAPFRPGIYSGTSSLHLLFLYKQKALDLFFNQDNPGPFLWWITNPKFQGPTSPKVVSKDKPFDLSAFDLLNATLDDTKKKTSDNMDIRLRDHIVMWQYETECNSKQGGTFAKVASGQHGEVDLDICTETAYTSMYINKYAKFDENDDDFK